MYFLNIFVKHHRKNFSDSQLYGYDVFFCIEQMLSSTCSLLVLASQLRKKRYMLDDLCMSKHKIEKARKEIWAYIFLFLWCMCSNWWRMSVWWVNNRCLSEKEKRLEMKNDRCKLFKVKKIWVSVHVRFCWSSLKYNVCICSIVKFNCWF